MLRGKEGRPKKVDPRGGGEQGFQDPVKENKEKLNPEG